MVSQSEEKKPSIKVVKDGPYLVRDLKNFRNSKGESIETKPMMALCRCGKSENKPFCDGAHSKAGFSGEKKEDRAPDKVKDYKGKKLTIHYNRGVCSHAASCVNDASSVFRTDKRPWIDPDAEDTEEIEKVIRSCPSGALSYSRDGVLHKDYPRPPEITICKDSFYSVVGYIELEDPDGSVPESKEHYTLCRCGDSKNKPFCDGTHWQTKFKDDKN
jgi:CDGSH-type Zn-finger protein/ferredoxin